MNLAIFSHFYTLSCAYYHHHLATFEDTDSLWKTNWPSAHPLVTILAPLDKQYS